MPQLINNIAQLKSVIGGVQKTMNWETWQPFVKQAAIKYIASAIGQTFYDELAAIATPTGISAQLIDRLRIAEGYYAYLIAFPQMTYSVGDAGITPNSPPNTVTMPKWMYVASQKNLAKKADEALETALVFLEKNEDSFNTWKASPEYTLSNANYINSATELSIYLPAAQNSRRFFLAIRQYLLRTQTVYIPELIGQELSDYFLEKLGEGTTLTAKEKVALQYLRTTLAHRALIDSLPFLNLNADLRLESETDGIVNEDEVSIDRLNAIRLEAQARADESAAKLSAYLDANASDTEFSAYYSSPLYTDQQHRVYKPFANDPEKKFFVL